MSGLDIKAARKTLGLTQQKMAALIGTKNRTWQDWEYGVTPTPGPVCNLIFLLIKFKGAIAAIKGKNETC